MSHKHNFLEPALLADVQYNSHAINLALSNLRLSGFSHIHRIPRSSPRNPGTRPSFRKESHPQRSLHLPPLQSPQLPDLLSLPVCLFWMFHLSGATQYVLFCIRLLSLVVLCFQGFSISGYLSESRWPPLSFCSCKGRELTPSGVGAASSRDSTGPGRRGRAPGRVGVRREMGVTAWTVWGQQQNQWVAIRGAGRLGALKDTWRAPGDSCLQTQFSELPSPVISKATPKLQQEVWVPGTCWFRSKGAQQ